jgi:hypothetical protein
MSMIPKAVQNTSILALAVVLAAPALVAQEPAPQQPRRPATFRSNINVVRVDIVVRDRNGEVVRGLKDTDFQVLEDGKAQTVTSFSFQEITRFPGCSRSRSCNRRRRSAR